MCFNALYRKELTANKDINCYKEMTIVKIKAGIVLKSWIFNYYMEIENIEKRIKNYYQFNKLYRATDIWGQPIEKLEKEVDDDKGLIYCGFHSYSNPVFAIEARNSRIDCIIPKGTKYYHNREAGEYVSLDIIFLNR